MEVTLEVAADRWQSLEGINNRRQMMVVTKRSLGKRTNERKYRWLQKIKVEQLLSKTEQN